MQIVEILDDPRSIAENVNCIYFDRGTGNLEFAKSEEIQKIYSEPGNISVGQVWIITDKVF